MTTHTSSTIYLYSSSHFPKGGWIQNCFWCGYHPTSDVKLFSSDHLSVKLKCAVKIHMCPRCSKAVSESDYVKAVNNYIKAHI